MSLRSFFGWSFLVSALLLGVLCSSSRADYCYAWSEYSLEWLVDASGAIAESTVADSSKPGGFDFRISAQSLLKKAKDFDLEGSQLVKGPSLGRALSYQGFSSYRLRPIYSEPSTYPPASRPSLRTKRLRRVKQWGPRDRCLVFFGKDTKQVLQIINLNRPVPFEDRFLLAADMHGNLIIDPDDLINRINARVAAGRKTTPDGSVRVRSDGFYYVPSGSQLDGDSYYELFVPPDAGLKEVLTTHYPKRSEQLKTILYWFYSGKTADDFRADWRKDFEKAVRTARYQWKLRNEPDTTRKPATFEVRNHRIGPGGWSCIISHDGRYFAYVNDYYLYLYDIHEEDVGRAALIHKSEAVDVHQCKMQFLPAGHSFVYSNADGTSVTVDLRKAKRLPIETNGRGDLR